MTHFKPGDRVRCVEVKRVVLDQLIPGYEYTVTASPSPDKVELNGIGGWFYADRFELVSRAKTYQDGLAEGRAAMERVRAEIVALTTFEQSEYGLGKDDAYERACAIITAEKDKING